MCIVDPIEKPKTPSDGALFVWENLLGGVCFHFDVHFISFCCHFCFWSSFCCHLLTFFIHVYFATSSLTLPWTITGFLNAFYTFSPAHHRVICNTFIFNHSGIFLPLALRFWVDAFCPQAFFTLSSFTNIWHNLLLSRPPWELAVLPWSLQGFITDLRNTDLAHLFVWITVNPQISYSEQFNFKVDHIKEKLLVVNSLMNN